MNSPVTNWRQTKDINSRVGKIGTVISWTKIFVAPSGFENDVPYYAGIVEFEKGKREALQFVDFDKEPEISQNVITVIRRIGKQKPAEVIQYGIKAKLYE